MSLSDYYRQLAVIIDELEDESVRVEQAEPLTESPSDEFTVELTISFSLDPGSTTPARDGASAHGTERATARRTNGENTELGDDTGSDAGGGEPIDGHDGRVASGHGGSATGTAADDGGTGPAAADAKAVDESERAGETNAETVADASPTTTSGSGESTDTEVEVSGATALEESDTETGDAEADGEETTDSEPSSSGLAATAADTPHEPAESAVDPAADDPSEPSTGTDTEDADGSTTETVPDEQSPEDAEKASTHASHDDSDDSAESDVSDGEAEKGPGDEPPDEETAEAETQESEDDGTPDDESTEDERVQCTNPDCDRSFDTERGMKIHRTKAHLPEMGSQAGDTPAHHDPERLSEVYEEHETFAEMTTALDVDVSAQAVRRQMIRHDVHEPSSDDSTVPSDSTMDEAPQPKEGEPGEAADPTDEHDEAADPTDSNTTKSATASGTTESRDGQHDAPDGASDVEGFAEGNASEADDGQSAVDDDTDGGAASADARTTATTTVDEIELDPADDGADGSIEAGHDLSDVADDVEREAEAEAGDPLSDIELPVDCDLSVDDVRRAVEDANTMYDVQRDLDLDTETARDLLTELDLLELVTGRAAGVSNREEMKSEIDQRIRQSRLSPEA